MPPPIPVSKVIKFNPAGGTVWVELKFNTLLLCTYTIMVRETKSNATIAEFKGDNANPTDDCYPLPEPASSNDGRIVWAVVTVVDQSGSGGDYAIDLVFSQDGSDIGIVSIPRKKIQGTTVNEVLVARLAT